MSRRRHLLGIAVACLLDCLVGCAEQGRRPPSPPPVSADIRTLVNELDAYDAEAEMGDSERPERLRPASFLGRIDATLEPGTLYSTTRWERVGGEWYVLIDPLSDSLVARLEAKLLPGDREPGFAVLSFGFWKEVRELQRKRLKVAFLSGSNKRLDGIYHSDERLIGVDLLANPGTLAHEYRHHLQHLAIVDNGRAAPRTMSERCFAETSRYFGELDATTTQLPYWEHALDSFEVTPERHWRAKSDRSEPWPQQYALRTNLQYPVDTSKSVNEKICPEPLVHVVNEADAEVTKLSEKILEATQELRRLRASHRAIASRWSDTQDEAAGTRLRARIAQIREEGPRAKEAVNAAIRAAVAERTKRLRAVFWKLGWSTWAELCRWSGGFALLNDCALPKARGGTR